MNNWATSLAVFDDGGGAALYAGGGISSFGDVAVNAIAKWSGASWSALGNGMHADVSPWRPSTTAAGSTATSGVG